jgi:5-methylcytosine-specific restriction endonuclease McrA
MKVVRRLFKAAKDSNVEVVKKINGHFQLKGPLMVNYYPYSKNRAAYVAGTLRSVKGVTPENAVKMCFEQPKSQGDSHRRGKNTRKKRAALIRKGVTTCYWCDAPLTLDTSTIEHIIPLSTNGLDNANNRTLACQPCNKKRGNVMLELKETT